MSNLPSSEDNFNYYKILEDLCWTHLPVTGTNMHLSSQAVKSIAETHIANKIATTCHTLKPIPIHMYLVFVEV